MGQHAGIKACKEHVLQQHQLYKTKGQLGMHAHSVSTKPSTLSTASTFPVALLLPHPNGIKLPAPLRGWIFQPKAALFHKRHPISLQLVRNALIPQARNAGQIRLRDDAVNAAQLRRSCALHDAEIVALGIDFQQRDTHALRHGAEQGVQGEDRDEVDAGFAGPEVGAGVVKTAVCEGLDVAVGLEGFGETGRGGLAVVVVEGGDGGREGWRGEGAGDDEETVGVETFLELLAEMVGYGYVGLDGEDRCVGGGGRGEEGGCVGTDVDVEGVDGGGEGDWGRRREGVCG